MRWRFSSGELALTDRLSLSAIYVELILLGVSSIQELLRRISDPETSTEEEESQQSQNWGHTITTVWEYINQMAKSALDATKIYQTKK